MTTTHTNPAAERIAAALPTPTPLTVAPYDPAAGPASDAAAVRAHHVGAASADLVLVAGDATADALAGAGAGATIADILRPALEEAAQELGPGVLDAAQTGPLGEAFADPDIEVYALVDAEGVTQAWFGLRERVAEPARQQAPPQPIDEAAARARMRVLQDVELVLTAEIGRTRLPMRQVLDLVPGTILELDRAAGDPADVMVNGRLVARGEVVVVDEDYGIRITEILSPEAGH
ncbi:flagellar motor switch protein FliN [Demequina aestuarii]|uniref:flagellar motor switch protein FliN n=1 Tax=Demequina aestuarii TaxID=327095 RepID=UPI0007811667|nr:flagellar motor switch protein FliN [Demequina aestuarii]